MPEEKSLDDYRNEFQVIVEEATHYFEQAIASLDDISYTEDRDFCWDQLPDSLHALANNLVHRLVDFSGQIASLLKSSVLVDEGGRRNLSIATKSIRAALLLRRFEHWDIEVLHDEGDVLGVRPPRQSYNNSLHPYDAKKTFEEFTKKLLTLFSYWR